MPNEKLIKTCSNGSDTIISKERPEEGSPDNTIRAGLIRALLLGTGDRTPRPGAGDRGAWITEQLDLDGEVVPVRLVLVSCTFEEDVILLDCTLPEAPSERLPTARTQCPAPALRGVTTSAAWISSDRQGRSTRREDHRAAELPGGRFLAKNVALNCYAITVGADVFLRADLRPRAQ